MKRRVKIMKKTFKKYLCYVLTSLTLFNLAAAVTVYAEEYTEAPRIGFIEAVQSEDSGYISDSYVDENGNEIEIKMPEEQLLYCNSYETSSVPSSYDSRDNGLCLAPRYQASTNNCWIFATIGALEANSMAKNITDSSNTNFSEAHLSWFASRVATDNTADPTYGDGKNLDSPYKEGGNWRIVTAALARRSGIANESDFPFIFNNISAMGNYSEADRYNHGSGVILESSQELITDNAVKDWIKENGCVTVAYCHKDTMYNSSNYSYYCSTESTPNHQVTIIGWDDEYSAENFSESGIPEGDGAWLCQNTWGVSWGDNGYFWISYYDATLTDFYGFTVRSDENLYKNYTYNGAEYNTCLIASSGQGAANVFRAGGHEKIDSVSFYTKSPETFVRVSIYKNLDENYSNPNKGTLAATIEQTMDNSGFHTLYLDTPVALEEGEIFSVTVQYYHSSGTVHIPIEMNSSSRPYRSNEKETYVLSNPDRNRWYQASQHGFQNAFIQVTTECNHSSFSTSSSESTCISNGKISEICDCCGKTVSEEYLPLTAHSYGEWSEYSHDSHTGKEVSTRECSVCGSTQTQSYYSGGSNTINILDFLQMIFESVFGIFRHIK